jgi:hypothetical protein
MTAMCSALSRCTGRGLVTFSRRTRIRRLDKHLNEASEAHQVLRTDLGRAGRDA